MVTFNGPNTYTGGTYVNAGTLVVAQTAALPAFSTSGSVNVSSGATLEVQAGGTGQWDPTSLGNLLGTTAFASGSTLNINVAAGNSFAYGNDLGSAQTAKGLVVSGSGLLALSGSSTYTGGTSINGGTLSVGAIADSGSSASNIGPSGGLNFNGGTLLFTGALSNTTARAVTFNSGGGTFNVSSGSLALTGLWSGSGGVTKTGAGLLIVGNNISSNDRFLIGSASGGTLTVAAGTVNIAPTSYFTMGDNGNNATYNQTGGVVNLTAPSGSYLGNGSGGTSTFTVSGGTFNQSSNLMRVGQGGTSTGIVNVGGGAGMAVANIATLDVGGANSTSASGVINLQTNGLLNVSALTQGSGTATTFNFSGGTLRAAAAATWLSGVSTYVKDAGGTVDNGGFAVTIGQALLHGGSNSTDGGLVFQGAGTTTLSASSGYNGGTTLSNGVLVAGNSAAFGSGQLAMNGGTLADSFATGSSPTLPNNILVNAVAGNALGTASYNLPLGGNLSGSGTLAKWGSQSVFLSGSNAGFTGTYVNNAGNTFFASGGTAASAAATWVVNGGNLANTLSGADDRPGALSGSGGQVGNNVGSSQVTYSIGGLNANSTYSGTIVDSIAGGGTTAISVTGSGMLALAGANTFSGGATVGSGTLTLAGQNALQNSTLTMNGGGLVFSNGVTGHAFTLGGLAAPASGPGYDIALQDNAATPNAVALTAGGNNANTTYSAVLSGAGSLTKAGTGTLTLSAANTFSGATAIGSGALLLGNSAAVQNSTVNINANSGLLFAAGLGQANIGGLAGTGSLALQDQAGTPAAVNLTVGGNGASTAYYGMLSGPGGLVKTGSGTLAIGGSNGGYSGPVTVNSGVLAVTGVAGMSGNLLGSGPITLAGGTLRVVAPGQTIGLNVRLVQL